MSLLSGTAKSASITALVVLAGCAQQAPLAASPVAYNPPKTALAARPPADVAWYFVGFASGSDQIGAAGQQAITIAAARMRGDSALTATVTGKTDSVGSDATNMRLSEMRANAVRNALVETGNVAANRIDTRWTGERQSEEASLTNIADADARMVNIGVH
jgi:OOP family OmpA-OmpF porin